MFPTRNQVPASPMKSYRAYILNKEGHVISYAALDCTTDEQAIARAEQLLEHDIIEVWELGRKVATLRPTPQTLH